MRTLQNPGNQVWCRDCKRCFRLHQFSSWIFIISMRLFMGTLVTLISMSWLGCVFSYVYLIWWPCSYFCYFVFGLMEKRKKSKGMEDTSWKCYSFLFGKKENKVEKKNNHFFFSFSFVSVAKQSAKFPAHYLAKEGEWLSENVNGLWMTYSQCTRRSFDLCLFVNTVAVTNKLPRDFTCYILK